jgi:hypothetical protein
MSLANPIVLKVKKTPIREIMSVFRGTVPHIDLVVFIGYAPLGANRTIAVVSCGGNKTLFVNSE